MSKQLTPPLEPRDGKTLVAAAVCRSGTADESLQSADEQFRDIQSFLADMYSGPIEWINMSSPRSGGINDKPFSELWNLITSDRLDVVICASLDRLGRWRSARLVLELCEARNVRLIAIREPFDTLRREAMREFFDAIEEQLEDLRLLFRRLGRPD